MIQIKHVEIEILGGQNQIGGNIILIGYAGQQILLDIGMPLEGNGFTPGPEPVVEKLKSVSYCLISHSHQDHWGYMDLLPKSCVIYSGLDTQSLIRMTRFVTHRPFIDLNWRTFQSEQLLELGEFSITPYLIDHSAFDAHAFLVCVGGVNLFYTGDIRFHGRKKVLSLKLAQRLKQTQIDLLLTEGTNLTNLQSSSRKKSESDLEDEFVKCFSANQLPAIVQMSGQNIDRLVTIFRACLKTNRMLVLDPYTAFVLSRLNHGKIPKLGGHWGIQVLMPEKEKMWESLGIVSTKVEWMGTEALEYEDLRTHQNYVLLFRYWIGQALATHDILPSGSSFIYSMSSYYLDHMSQQWGELAPRIQSGDLKFYQIHASGHAYPDDLIHFIDTIKPDTILPIHTMDPEWFQRFGKKILHDGDTIE